MSNPVIDVESLSYAYPDGTSALDDISLHIHQGERVALLGPNGAGKTTLVMHLNGIIAKQSGKITVSGLEVARENMAQIRRNVGVVFQDPDDQLFMPTVEEDVAFGPKNQGVKGEELNNSVRAAMDAAEVGDLATRPPNHLSFGQKRRVAIAGVLAMRPHILVLDEPTSNLDPASRRELVAVLSDLPVTQLIVTHDLSFALQMCTRTVILDNGRLVADDRTAAVLGDAALLERHRLSLPYGFRLES